jgi:lysophospholipase L1-like esterase
MKEKLQQDLQRSVTRLKYEYRFTFTDVQEEQGWISLHNNPVYDLKQGYGFAEAPVFSKNEDLRDSWPGEYFIPAVKTLLVNVPSGNYSVTVTLGSQDRSSETIMKEGLGRVVLAGVQTEAGQIAQEEFAVHVEDGQLKLAYSGQAPAVRSIEIRYNSELPTLFLAGDSTVTDQSSGQYPYTGWGQAVGQFLNGGIAVSNHARSGRSSKSFIGEDRLNRIWKRIRPSDYLLIQFAHNDEKDDERGTLAYTTYKEYLSVYINGARERGAYPVLVSAMHRRFFDEEGRIKNTHGDYIPAMEELARELQVPYINLAEKSKRLFEELGEEATMEIFMWVAPNQYAGLPEGTQDNTHFSEKGATAIARLVAECIREAEIQPLQSYLRSN